MIYQSDHELRSLRWEIGALPIRCRINKSSKPLLKIGKLKFTKISGNSQKPLLSQDNLPPCLTGSLSLIHCRPVTYLTHLETAHQSSKFVRHHLSLSSLIYFWVRLPACISCQLSSQEAPLS